MHIIHRYHDISCGHRVSGHENKCANLHGHNYRITFTCASRQDSLDGIGRVVDFGVVKATLCEWLETNWDHRFLVWVKDPWVNMLASIDPHGVVVVPFNPTAENMAQWLVEVVAPQYLDHLGIIVLACKVEETRKCSATFLREGAI